MTVWHQSWCCQCCHCKHEYWCSALMAMQRKVTLPQCHCSTVFQCRYENRGISSAGLVQIRKSCLVNIVCTASLTLLSLDKMPAISQTKFPNAFIRVKKRMSIKISLKFVPKGPINNIPALVQIMAWRRPGHKPLSEPLLTQLTDVYMRH